MTRSRRPPPGDVRTKRASRRQTPRWSTAAAFAGIVLAAAVPGAAATTTVRTAPAGRAQPQYLTMASYGRRDAAILVSIGPANGRHCAFGVYSTVDGAAHWRGPAVFDHGPVCQNDLAYEALSVADDGSWWAAVLGRLYTGSLTSGSVHRVTVPDGGSSPVPVCSVAAAGRSAWVSVGANCSRASQLMRSADGGRTWTAVRSIPLSRLVASPAAGPVVLESASTVFAIGLPQGATLTNGAYHGPLAVARSDDGGRTWLSSDLPCPGGVGGTRWFQGLAAASGRDLVAECLGGAADSSQTTDVVFSDNDGVTWAESCGNGFFGEANLLGRCPSYGQPMSLAALGDGELLAALGNLGLEASSDHGRSWHQLGPTGAPFVALSGSGAAEWAFEFYPAGYASRGWLAVSTNGTTWHRVSPPR